MKRIAFGVIVALAGCGGAEESETGSGPGADDSSGAGAGSPASSASGAHSTGSGSTTGAGGETPGPKPTPARIPPGTWVAIDAGTFTMGAPASESCFTSDNQHVHAVTLTRAFEITATEMTQAEHVALTGTNPSNLLACGLDCPVDTMSWHAAAAACNAMSAYAEMPPCYACTGSGNDATCEPLGDPYACWGYRLPTEAEWEYAYRAGTSTPVYAGDLTICGSLDPTLDAIAWFLYNAAQSTHPVGEKAPNAWGLFDMSGNVWEWTHDGYVDVLGDAVDPVTPSPDGVRVMRGGSYNCIPGENRAAHKSALPATVQGMNVGLRCARTL